MRTAWLLCVLVACDAGVKPGAPAASVVEELPKPLPRDPALVDGRSLAYLPPNADLVVHVDVALLRKSSLWSTYEQDLERMLLPRVTCDYHALRDVVTVDVGVLIEAKRAVFVVRGANRDKLAACVRATQNVASLATGHVPGSSPQDGRSERFAVPRDTAGDQKQVPDDTATASPAMTDVLEFVDATTMIVARGHEKPNGLDDALAARTAPLAHDHAFGDVLRLLPAQAAVTLASRPGSTALVDKSLGMGPLAYMFGTLTTTPGHVVVRISTAFDDHDRATQMANMFNAQVKNDAVKRMFEKLGATAQGKVSTMEIGVTDAQLAELVRLMRGIM